jgi:hypothetical protein
MAAESEIEPEIEFGNECPDWKLVRYPARIEGSQYRTFHSSVGVNPIAKKEISRGTARIQRIADDAKEFGLKERVPVMAVSAGILT